MRKLPDSWCGKGMTLGTISAVCLLAAALLLPGCKRNETGQLPAASGEAIQAEREAVKGFALVRAYPDQGRDSLAIALEFSRPLVGTQDFDKLLTFAEKVGDKSGWSLDEGGKVLRFPFVEPNREYTLRISGELAAADGSKLGRDVEKKVYTGELDPAVGFASQGSVLPAKESRGLPVVSVNVGEVDVEFLRVREKSLPTFFAQYQRAGRKGSWELDNEYDEDHKPLAELAEPVYVNRFVLGGERNERVLTYLPLQDIEELQQPGLYFAVMKKAGAFRDQYETAFFTVSDIGLHARAYEDKLFVHTASLESGAALGGVELRVLDAKGEAVFKAETDGNGNAMLDYALDAAHVLTATKGGDVSLLPFNQPALDLSEFAVSGREQAWFDVFAWSGRDLYRPGETVRVSALLRDQDGKPVAAKKGGRTQPLFVRLKQPDGKTFVESRIEPGALGYFRFEKTIPAEAPTGRWQVEFRTDPGAKEAVQGMTLRIEEFLPERMKLDLDSADAVLKPGQPFKLAGDGCVSLRRTGGRQPFHGQARGCGRTASARTAARLLLRRSDGGTAEGSEGCRRRDARCAGQAAAGHSAAVRGEGEHRRRRGRLRQPVRNRRPQRQPQRQARAVASRGAGRRAAAVRRRRRQRCQRQCALRAAACRQRRPAASC